MQDSLIPEKEYLCSSILAMIIENSKQNGKTLLFTKEMETKH